MSFRYPTRGSSWVLRDFNLTVPSGQTVALVGASGSGKTSTLALLQRFYEPEVGEVSKVNPICEECISNIRKNSKPKELMYSDSFLFRFSLMGRTSARSLWQVCASRWLL